MRVYKIYVHGTREFHCGVDSGPFRIVDSRILQKYGIGVLYLLFRNHSLAFSQATAYSTNGLGRTSEARLGSLDFFTSETTTKLQNRSDGV